MLNSSDILRGYTDTIILAQLAEGDSYGYVISKNVFFDGTSNELYKKCAG